MIGVIGDLHFRDKLGYAEYVEDGRIPEEQEVLDFIVKNLEDCSSVVFMGDQLNSRTNSPHVIKKFVEFLERFDDKKLFIIKGNHEAFGDGRSAIDFLKEIKGKKWTIISDDILTVGSHVFCPYFTKSELEAKDNKDALSKVMKKLKDAPGDILFVHHAISDSLSAGVSVNLFPEVVLPKKKLQTMYKLVVGGHIHSPQEAGGVVVTGSVFNNEVGETEKFIWKITDKTLKVEQIKLPGRPIYKLENPTVDDIAKLEKHSIVKAVLTKETDKDEIKKLSDELKKFDAHMLLEQIPSKRKKIHLEEGANMLEFSIEELLEVYAKEKKVDINKLKQAFELIK